MARADRGSVWIVDLGMVAKVRPCLVLSVPTDPQDRVLVTLVPRTTSVQGTRFEVAVQAKFLPRGRCLRRAASGKANGNTSSPLSP
jgi:mRNA interferase MazF